MEQGGTWWKAVFYGLPVSEIVLMGCCLYRLTAPFMERKKGALRAGMAYVLVMGGIYVLFLRLEGLSLRRMMGALAVFLVMCRTDRRNYGQKAFLVQTFSRCTGSPGRWRKWYTIICIILSEIQTI